MINTNNDFLMSLGGGGVQPLIPMQIKTRQQAYRAAAWIKLMGEMLPPEELNSTYEEVETAIANT